MRRRPLTRRAAYRGPGIGQRLPTVAQYSGAMTEPPVTARQYAAARILGLAADRPNARPPGVNGSGAADGGVRPFAPRPAPTYGDQFNAAIREQFFGRQGWSMR